MKTPAYLTILLLCISIAVSAQNQSKVVFGIFETVNVSKLPGSFMKTLKQTDFTFERNNQVPIIGYIEMSNNSILQTDLSRENFIVAKTNYTFDKEGKYCALVALKRNATIDNTDINSTEANGRKVEIHFNLKGAKKWAELTKNNIGKMLAFTIDGKIYTLPRIMSEIKTGEALINGLGSETEAIKISEALNASISK